MPSSVPIEQLKARLASLSRPETDAGPGRFTLGLEAVDRHLDPGPCLSRLHDIHARSGPDAVAANAFALGMATRACGERPLLWVFQGRAGQEAGGLSGAGLHEWGLRPERLLVVRVRDATAMLAASEEALKSGAVGAVLMSGWGEARAMTLTASRRLALAAQAGRSTGFLVRASALVCPSAAETRWSVAAALSTGLEAGAPGRPAFTAALTRSRQGAVPAEWTMEWDRERLGFREPAPLSGRLVPAVVGGSVAARGVETGLRRTG